MDTAIVVGAGPAGLAAAAQLRRAQIPTVVLEQGEAIAPRGALATTGCGELAPLVLEAP